MVFNFVVGTIIDNMPTRRWWNWRVHGIGACDVSGGFQVNTVCCSPSQIYQNGVDLSPGFDTA